MFPLVYTVKGCLSSEALDKQTMKRAKRLDPMFDWIESAQVINWKGSKCQRGTASSEALDGGVLTV